MGEEYTIADMQAFPWVFISKKLGAPLDDFPQLAAWRETIKQRPAVQRAIDLGKAGAQHDQNASNNNVLFNQGAGHLMN